jgi:hypothetical protein
MPDGTGRYGNSNNYYSQRISWFYSPAMIAAFHNVFVDIASRNGMAYIPFLLKGVAGDPQLNLYDRIHPTPPDKNSGRKCMGCTECSSVNNKIRLHKQTNKIFDIKSQP